jgi:hypothetical protein
LIHFRVRLRQSSLSVSTMRKKGGEAVRTWDTDFSRIDEVRVAERRGARTSMSGLYIKPRGGDLMMFCWQKNAAGAPEREAKTYYAAAIATLRTLAENRPDLVASIGPHGTASIVGTGFWALIFLIAAYLAIGELNTTFAIAAAAIVAVYGYSAARSGAFRKTRRVSLAEAANELAENAPR